MFHPNERSRARDAFGRQQGGRGGGRGGAYSAAMATTEVTVGEAGVADVVVQVPYELNHEMLRLGEPAHLIVVSNTPNLSSFKAVRDIFLPETRQWLYEYPFVSRRGFQQVADRVHYSKGDQAFGGTKAGRSRRY